MSLFVECSTCGTRYNCSFTRSTCETCTIKLSECKRKMDEAQAELQLVKLKLPFLRLQFDNQPQAEAHLGGDTVILVQGRTDELLYVHKFILSNRSSVFRNMFTARMLEEATGMVRIDDCTLPVMHAVIKFCYEGEINFSKEVPAEEVMEVAHKYDIALLRKVSEEELMRTVNHLNLSARLKLAIKFSATGLEGAASQYLKNHFENVISKVLVDLC